MNFTTPMLFMLVSSLLRIVWWLEEQRGALFRGFLSLLNRSLNSGEKNIEDSDMYNCG